MQCQIKYLRSLRAAAAVTKLKTFYLKHTLGNTRGQLKRHHIPQRNLMLKIEIN